MARRVFLQSAFRHYRLTWFYFWQNWWGCRELVQIDYLQIQSTCSQSIALQSRNWIITDRTKWYKLFSSNCFAGKYIVSFICRTTAAVYLISSRENSPRYMTLSRDLLRSSRINLTLDTINDSNIFSEGNYVVIGETILFLFAELFIIILIRKYLRL